MIRGNIAIPDTPDPKRWRARGRKRKPSMVNVPTIINGVRSPQEIAREKRRRRIMGEA